MPVTFDPTPTPSPITACRVAVADDLNLVALAIDSNPAVDAAFDAEADGRDVYTRLAVKNGWVLAMIEHDDTATPVSVCLLQAHTDLAAHLSNGLPTVVVLYQDADAMNADVDRLIRDGYTTGGLPLGEISPA